LWREYYIYVLRQPNDQHERVCPLEKAVSFTQKTQIVEQSTMCGRLLFDTTVLDDPDDEVHKAMHDRCGHNVPEFSAANEGTHRGLIVLLAGYPGSALATAQEQVSY